MGTGPLHVPKLPGHPRHRDVPRPLVPHQPVGLRLHRRRPGRAPRWTGWPTSGSPSSAPARPPCSACRTWPVPAGSSTCSSAHRRRSTCATTGRPTRSGSPAIATPGWQQRWLENFTANQTGGTGDEDLVMDGWTDLARRIRGADRGAAARGAAPWRACGGVRGLRLREDGGDPGPGRLHRGGSRHGQPRSRRGTASCASGRASTTSTCRRTTSPARTWSTPTARASSASPRPAWSPAAREYEVDCIIYASGFEVGTEYTRRAGFDVDRARRRDAVRVLGRRHAHPARHPRARLPERVRRASRPRARTSSRTCRTTSPSRAARSRWSSSTRSTGGYAEVEVTKEAEDAWVELLLDRRLDARLAGLHARLLQQRGPPAAGPGPGSTSATRRGRWPTSPTSTSGAAPARSTASTSAECETHAVQR